MESVSQRFLRYVTFDTQSDEFSETCPSTEKQRILGEKLVAEMLAIGIADAHMDEKGYIYGTLPGDPSFPKIGLIAHMDTSPSYSGADIKAKTVLYHGGDILLNEEKGIVGFTFFLGTDNEPVTFRTRSEIYQMAKEIVADYRTNHPSEGFERVDIRWASRVLAEYRSALENEENAAAEEE